MKKIHFQLQFHGFIEIAIEILFEIDSFTLKNHI